MFCNVRQSDKDNGLLMRPLLINGLETKSNSSSNGIQEIPHGSKVPIVRSQRPQTGTSNSKEYQAYINCSIGQSACPGTPRSTTSGGTKTCLRQNKQKQQKIKQQNSKKIKTIPLVLSNSSLPFCLINYFLSHQFPFSNSHLYYARSIYLSLLHTTTTMLYIVASTTCPIIAPHLQCILQPQCLTQPAPAPCLIAGFCHMTSYELTMHCQLVE